MARALLVALIFSPSMIGVSSSAWASAATIEQELSRAETFRRGFNSGVLHPDDFAEIDQERYTDPMLEQARQACMRNDARIRVQGCATLGTLTGRRAELAYRTRLAETDAPYIPYRIGPFANEAEREQAIRAYTVRVFPNEEDHSAAAERAAAFLEETRPCIDALERSARGSQARVGAVCKGG